MKIGMIQLNTAWHDKEANFIRAEGFIKEAADQHCDIVVLPEMFNTGYSMEIEVIGEELHGATSDFLKRVAAQYKTAIIGGYPAYSVDRKARNVAIAIDKNGDIAGTYFKIHPFSYAQEHLHYVAGETPVVFNIKGMSASVFICYDLRFPEAFRRVARSVDCIFVIANWPASRIDHWSALLAARAIENQCFIVGVNRTGTDGNGITYSGNSHVFSPSGALICTGLAHDELVITNIEVNEVTRIRAEFPLLVDMQITDEIE